MCKGWWDNDWSALEGPRGREAERPVRTRRAGGAGSLRTLAAAANSRESLTWALTIKLTCNNENVKHRECTARIAHDYALAD